MTAKPALETMYSQHHRQKRGDGFVLMGDERGDFLHNKIGTGKHVLDIGCRDGSLTAAFLEGNSVVGIDIDSHALELAGQKGIQTEQIDLNGEWEIPPNTFDVVVAAEVLEHLYYPRVVVGKIQQVLTKEGVFLGSVPNAFSFKHRLRYMCMQKKGTPLEDPTHINHFTVSELYSILAECFEEVHVYGIGRYRNLARLFPQQFAFDLIFEARHSKK